ncbi:hypothetical protein BS47DRAFT_1350914 [Hydnum rufescens UP504]|uniref:Uncharacterized protein n=1 Tax=Hydnum rufescens UP504 TaxID=1448309 RepID=A0A9P6DQY4_9AGAM|nr:hypothetical protein BS47DRAFT_1350914 [Hydnum rufescens UP504]
MASRRLKNESWFRRVDSSRLGRLERAKGVRWANLERNLAQCSCEVSRRHCPRDHRYDDESDKGSADYGDEESKPGVSRWLTDIRLRGPPSRLASRLVQSL